MERFVKINLLINKFVLKLLKLYIFIVNMLLHIICIILPYKKVSETSITKLRKMKTCKNIS